MYKNKHFYIEYTRFREDTIKSKRLPRINESMKHPINARNIDINERAVSDSRADSPDNRETQDKTLNLYDVVPGARDALYLV